MVRILGQGEHYGKTLKQCRSLEVTLSEVTYAPMTQHERHGNLSALLVFVKNGAYEKRVGSALLTCAPGDLIFIPAQQLQADNFGTKLTRCVIATCSSLFLSRVTADGARLLEVKCFSGAEFANSVIRLEQELGDPDSFSPLIIEGLILDVLARKARNEVRGKGPAWLRRARELLQEHASDVSSIRSIAEQVGIHPAHLASEFRRYFGCTPGDYLRRYRVTRAADLIKGADTSVAQIAAECGFADQAHLSRWFRRQMGCSPTQYRRSVRSPERIQKPKAVQEEKDGVEDD